MKRSALALALCVFHFNLPVQAGPENGRAASRHGETTCERHDFDNTFLYWHRLAVEGSASAQYRIGWMYSQGKGVTSNNGEAVRWFRKAARQGMAQAQFKLAFMYRHGIGVMQSDQEAVAWYRKAADQGFIKAQRVLASMYETGAGAPRNPAEAAKWRQLAATDKEDVCDQLSRLYFNETGADRNRVEIETVAWLNAAPEEEIPPSTLYQIGLMYERGEGLPKNYIEATRWYCKAVDKDMPDPLVNLGMFYEYGFGVSANRVVAHALFSLYLDRCVDIYRSDLLAKRSEAFDNLKGLSAIMSAQEIRKAQTLKQELAKPDNFPEALTQYLKTPGLI